MGSGSSTNNPVTNLHKSESAVVKLMFPLYYSSQDISREEHKSASDGWNSILNDKTPEFLARKNDPEFGYSSCVIYFYDSFYTRLFNVHPMSRNLFKNGMRSQGKFLVKMITLALSEINDGVKFDKTLVKLAEVHNERGVKAIECKSKLRSPLTVTADLLFICCVLFLPYSLNRWYGGRGAVLGSEEGYWSEHVRLPHAPGLGESLLTHAARDRTYGGGDGAAHGLELPERAPEHDGQSDVRGLSGQQGRLTQQGSW